jgi:hypothetical protein
VSVKALYVKKIVAFLAAVFAGYVLVFEKKYIKA